jgi:hypothetical protein
VGISIDLSTYSVRRVLTKFYQYSHSKMVHTRKYLGFDFVWYFTTAYVPAEHKQNTSYIFLNKIYACIFSKIYMSTCKNKQRSIQLKFFLLHFILLTSRRIIYINSFFSLYLNLENTKQLTKSSQSISSYGCTIHHSRGMNRNIWGIRFIFRAPCLLRLFASKVKTQGSPVSPTGRCMSWQIL